MIEDRLWGLVVLLATAAFCYLMLMGIYYSIIQTRAQTTEINARAEAIKANGIVPMAYVKQVG